MIFGNNIFSFTNFLFFYTDPGSGQLVLQLLMATLLGGLFYFRKLKNLIFKRSTPGKTSEEPQPTDASETIEK